MTLKSTVRSINSAIRAAERDAKRRQKELERQQKEFKKMQALEQAQYEVEVYENHIEIIQSLHKECSPVIDWEEISLSSEPEKPSNSDRYEQEARFAAENYIPGFFDKLFKRVDRKVVMLSNDIKEAVQKDDAENAERLKDWENAVNDWKNNRELANALLSGDKQAKIKAINDLDPFDEISNLGSNIVILAENDNFLSVDFNVHSDDIVPSEVKSLLKSGKLSVKTMPKGRFNEIYQDYVCSSSLRIANEVFSIVPDDMIIITAVDNVLNSSTGHMEQLPILSVCISRSALMSLNLLTIDPSDAMKNFVHNMSFKKTQGFGVVSKVVLEEEVL